MSRKEGKLMKPGRLSRSLSLARAPTDISGPGGRILLQNRTITFNFLISTYTWPCELCLIFFPNFFDLFLSEFGRVCTRRRWVQVFCFCPRTAIVLSRLALPSERLNSQNLFCVLERNSRIVFQPKKNVGEVWEAMIIICASKAILSPSNEQLKFWELGDVFFSFLDLSRIQELLSDWRWCGPDESVSFCLFFFLPRNLKNPVTLSKFMVQFKDYGLHWFTGVILFTEGGQFVYIASLPQLEFGFWFTKKRIHKLQVSIVSATIIPLSQLSLSNLLQDRHKFFDSTVLHGVIRSLGVGSLSILSDERNGETAQCPKNL